MKIWRWIKTAPAWGSIQWCSHSLGHITRFYAVHGSYIQNSRVVFLCVAKCSVARSIMFMVVRASLYRGRPCMGNGASQTLLMQYLEKYYMNLQQTYSIDFGTAMNSSHIGIRSWNFNITKKCFSAVLLSICASQTLLAWYLKCIRWDQKAKVQGCYGIKYTENIM